MTSLIEELYANHARAIWLFLTSRLRDSHSCEDVLQEVFLRATARIDSFDGKHPRAWLFQIASNCLIDATRKSKQARSIDVHDLQLPSPVSNPDSAASPRLEALRACLSEIGSDFIDALIRTKIDRQSPSSLADSLGLPRATIDSRVARGKRLIADCIKRRLS